MIFNPWNSKYYKVSKEILKKKKKSLWKFYVFGRKSTSILKLYNKEINKKADHGGLKNR